MKKAESAEYYTHSHRTARVITRPKQGSSLFRVEEACIFSLIDIEVGMSMRDRLLALAIGGVLPLLIVSLVMVRLVRSEKQKQIKKLWNSTRS